VSRPHAAKEPQDCARCCEVHGVLVDDHARRSEQADVRTRAAAPLTVAEIGARVGIRDESVVRTHLAHLVAKGRLLADRRTPSGVPVRRDGEVPRDADPLAWASVQPVPHIPCGLLLVTLGGFGWSGTTADLLKVSGMKKDTAKKHRPCLVKAELAEFTRADRRTEDGRMVRLPDTFRLVVPVELIPVEQVRRDRYDRQAAEMLAAVQYLGGEDAGNPYVLAEVARALREGLPAAALRSMLTRDLPPVIHMPVPFLLSRVPKSGARVLISAAFAAELQRAAKARAKAAEQAPAEPSPWDRRPGAEDWRTARPVPQRRSVCPGCGRPAAPESVRCGGSVCLTAAWGAPDDLASVAGTDVAADVWVPGGRRPVLVPAL
jgi:predicted ArsR family transcriptional regulator